MEQQRLAQKRSRDAAADAERDHKRARRDAEADAAALACVTNHSLTCVHDRGGEVKAASGARAHGIAPSSFYGSRTLKEERRLTAFTTPLKDPYEVFPFQVQAFEYMDRVAERALLGGGGSHDAEEASVMRVFSCEVGSAWPTGAVRRPHAGSSFASVKREGRALTSGHAYEHGLLPAAHEETSGEAGAGGAGRRQFIVTSANEMFKRLSLMPRGARAYYELLREGVPCHLYLDLEFSLQVEENRARCGDCMVSRLVELLCDALEGTYNVRVPPSCVLELDASTETKFSRHIHMRLPDGSLFRSNAHVGAFVANCLDHVERDDSDGAPWNHVGAAGRGAGDRWKLALPCEHAQEECPDRVTWGAYGQAERQRKYAMVPFVVREASGRQTLFVDLGVYTRNRNFRMYGCCKEGKGNHLHKTRRCAFAFQHSLPCGGMQEDLFLRSLLSVPTSLLNRTGDCGETTLLECERVEEHARGRWCAGHCRPPRLDGGEGDPGWLRLDHFSSSSRLLPSSHSRLASHIPPTPSTAATVHGVSHSTPPCSSSAPCEVESSTGGPDRRSYPLLLAFIRSQIACGGVQGIIRDAAVSSKFKTIRFYVARNRFCHNIGRPHRSNNIFITVSLSRGTFYQQCLDPDCQAMNYRSPEKKLPRAVKEELEPDWGPFPPLGLDDEEAGRNSETFIDDSIPDELLFQLPV